MGANSVMVREPGAQLPWEPLVAEGVAEGAHEDRVLEAFHAREQMAGVVRTAQAVPLLQDDWALVGSWSVAYDGTHEDCAVAAEAEVEAGALTCIVVIQSRS